MTHTTEDTILIEADMEDAMLDMPLVPITGSVQVRFELDAEVHVMYEITGTPRCPEFKIVRAEWGGGEVIDPTQYKALNLQQRVEDTLVEEGEFRGI